MRQQHCTRSIVTALTGEVSARPDQKMKVMALVLACVDFEAQRNLAEERYQSVINLFILIDIQNKTIMITFLL